MSASPEVELARSLLSDGDVAGRGVRSHSLRAACWLTRVALEQAVVDLLAVRGVDAGAASMRSKLSALEVAYRDIDPTIPQRAQYSWDRLSNAAHYHAFELTPGVVEVRELVEAVAILATLCELRDGRRIA